MRSGLFILLFLFSIISEKISAQCCAAGNPVGGDGSNEGSAAQEIILFTSFKHSLSTDYYHNESKVSIPYIEKSYFDYQSISIIWGISPKLSLYSELGYFYNKTQELNIANEKEMIRSTGLGDWALNVRYVPVKTVKPLSQFVISGGMKIPVGAFNEEINGITIPVSLQPSSGALKFNGSIFYTRKRIEQRFGWNAFVLFETSNTIKQDYLIYKYGNYGQIAFAGTYAFSKELVLVSNFKLELRDHDRREQNIIVQSSGSRVIYVNPQLIYVSKNYWRVILMVDIPIYKYVNGYQLTNKFSFQFGISKRLSFCKTDT